ncbi:hypothetical protein DZK27_09690 [Rhodobacteraceae bacterium 63075]|nr:hypothetical protein DZK27_09690 [Rhodobacteraceae bacterium 63075]
MAHENKVMRSLGQEGGPLRVDIFRRPDGSFGFEEYRRDPEEGRGWFSLGHHGGRVFDSEAGALAAARAAVRWLAQEG